jgi:anti-anti-sigma factor
MPRTLARTAARLYTGLSRNGDSGAESAAGAADTVRGVAERLALDMEHHDEGVVLRLSGRLDADTVAVLTGALRAVDEARHGTVRIDLEHVTAIDGVGIRLLLEAESAAAAEGRTVEVRGLQASLRRRAPFAPPPSQPTELDGAAQ